MNFDSRTEAEIEREAEEHAQIVDLMARTCAQLQLAYNATEAEAFAVAFEEAWGRASRYISAVEFYHKVTQATARLTAPQD